MNTPNFSDIYTLYFEDVYKYLLALCHDEELAEELAQDTFFKAMKSYENFRGDCKITTWLCQIAKHSFFLYEKHRKRNIDLNSVENEIVDTNSIEILLGQREQAFGIHIVLTAIFGTYYALFIRQNSMVSPEQISISAYSLTDEQITFRLELLDGYCGGTIKTYTDENRNLYISVLRTVIKEELSDGETEIMNYGFNHEKKDYIAVYYGTPNNCELIWKKGDLLPTAPKDIFE